MLRRGSLAIVLLFPALVLGPAAEDASAHAGLGAASPAIGAEIGATPKFVRLLFSEQPEASLSDIRVSDASGASYQRGAVQPVPGTPLALSVPVRALPRGVYTVDWRVVSAVDGHATSGSYAFGVRVKPTGAAATTSTTSPATSWRELVARWILLIGLVALLGAAVAAVARFGGEGGTDLKLAAGGWCVSVIGVLLLADAQRRTAGTSLSALLGTPVGHALRGRAVSIAAAGAALLLAWRAQRRRRAAFLVAACAVLAAIIVHVAEGHAAAGSWPEVISVGAQSAHFAAAGVWFGGLAALLLGIRGAPSAEKAAAVRRFAVVAVAALVVVLVTGTVRAIDELSSVGQLITSGYGRAVLAKIALFGLILGIAARNRRRSVPAAATDLNPLRRNSRVELGLALVALAVAALLGTLAPPVSGNPGAIPGISVSGSDFGTSVRVQLTAASNQPGPNRFVAQVDDFDSGEPIAAGKVSLGFTPLDDPDVAPTTLKLHRAADGSYVGTGANLAFDGRWRVTALIERGADSVEVPLALDLPIPRGFLTVERIPTLPVSYKLQVPYSDISLVPVPGRSGPNRILVRCLGGSFDDPLPLAQIVLTVESPGRPARQQPVRRLARGRFVAAAELEPGPNTVTVVARTTYGTRITGQFRLRIPRH